MENLDPYTIMEEKNILTNLFLSTVLQNSLHSFSAGILTVMVT